MNYVKMAIEYVFKNWWRIFLPLIPIAIIAGFIIVPYETASALYDLTATGPKGFDEFAKVFNLVPTWYEVIEIILTVVIGAIFISYSFISVYRHFRTGKFSIRTPFAYINSGIIPTLKIIAIIACSVLLYRLVIVFVISLFNYVFSLLGVGYIFTLIFAYVIVVFGCVSGTVLLSTAILVFPQMYIYGYSIVDAWKGVSNMSITNKDKFIAIFIPMLMLILCNYLLILFGATYFVVVIIRSILYLLVLAYFVVLSQTITFAECGFERRDLQKYLPYTTKKKRKGKK